MSHSSLMTTLWNIEPAISLAALVVMLMRKNVGTFRFLAWFLGVRAVRDIILMFLVAIAGRLVPETVTYPLYFFIYWGSYTLESLLGFGVIYTVFRQAMAPLPGLQSLGKLMFRWALGVSVLVSVIMGLSANTGYKFVIKAVLQLEQAESVLTLCMLFFVTLSIKPMGLSVRSRLFGVNLGLGVLATATLISGALTSHSHLGHGWQEAALELMAYGGLLIWAAYFAMPEPRRRMILLPTTSPFLRWNQISLALNDAPGFVAVGDVTLDMFAPAELEVMRRASAKMGRSPVPASTRAATARHRVSPGARDYSEGQIHTS